MSGRKQILAIIAFPLAIGAILAAAFPFYPVVARALQSREAFETWMRATGILPEFAFVGLQVVQVIVFVIPGEFAQMAGGWYFGAATGTLLSIAGIMLGSTFNFFVARVLGIPFVNSVFGEEKLVRVSSLIKAKRASAGFFLLFVIPGIPKDVLCYAAGISKLGFFPFFAISMAGRLPGIMGSSMIGASAAAGDRTAALAIAAVACVLFFAGLYLKDWIHDKIGELTIRRDKEAK